MPLIITTSLLLILGISWYAFRRTERIQHRKLYQRPLTAQWLTILENKVPLYRRMPSDLKSHLHGCIQLFLHEKEFVGHGIDINDDIRVTIAGNACLLLLNRQQQRFPHVETVIIYPDTYVAQQTVHNGSIQSQHEQTRAGESWVGGPVVLSWGDSLRGSLNARDGHNVVLHEFAHKLDEQSGDMNGLPPLQEHSHYAEWSSVLNKEFIELQARTHRGKRSVLDNYGSVSAPEFFAVATETFFEKSVQMQTKLPELYAQLSRYYGIDPANW